MLPYSSYPQHIPQARRAEINEKILYVIDAGSDALTKEVIYNCYTGKGGLHGLAFKDYANYNEFGKAKRDFEEGQFFTPHDVCRRAVEVAGVLPSETVCDPCCGMGNFFNWLPAGVKVWGNELDHNAAKVARHLYPDANITAGDVRWWDPGRKFDVLFQNPPFNLEFEMDGEKTASQFYCAVKAHDLLESAGLMILVVPVSFMADVFWNRTEVSRMNELFSFIGQYELPDDAFSASGVEAFPTKAMAFFRRSENIPHTDYDGSFCSEEQLRERIGAYRTEKHSAKMKLIRETLSQGDGAVNYEIKKNLFHLKHHPALSKQYEGALAYIEKYRTQKPPVNAGKDEMQRWEQAKITPEKILSYCRRALLKQNHRPEDKVRLVYDNDSIHVKAYSPKMQKAVSEAMPDCTAVKRYVAESGKTSLKSVFSVSFGPDFDRDLRAAGKRLRKKNREFDVQTLPIRNMSRSAELDSWLRSRTFVNGRGQECHLTDLQVEDMGLVMQKRYALLNWQQGSGKTAAAYFFGKRLLESGKARSVFVLAPALAINLTWSPFLKAQSEGFVLLKNRSDIENFVPGGFALISTTIIGTLKREMMTLVRKRLGNKACLLFDESDELTNPHSVRTKATLDVFRALRYKLLCTGTTTRNNIGELYSQLELLYNNSVNMLCLAPDIYVWDRELEEIVPDVNDCYGKPFPARGGAALFRRCYCPGRATVFGIEKFSQDVYNAPSLNALVSQTMTTRKFIEFAGEKYSIHNHTVTPTTAEFSVYKKILCELQEIAPLYFHTTGDTRKEAALRLIRTISLLVKACSVPHLMPGYDSGSLPSKVGEILSMVRERSGKKVAVGTATLDALAVYRDVFEKTFRDRPLFVIDGSVEFRRRDRMLKEFEATGDGILLCTQQSLKSSVNIPTCNEVILEALQWNIPKMSQFYFRAIRFDSEEWTNVHFVTYEKTIEQNIMALLLTKERLNEFLADGEIRSEEEMFSQYGVSPDLLDELLGKERDEKGDIHFTWGNQRVFG